MEPTISIVSDAVEREVSVGNITNKEEKSLESFFSKVSDGAHFDTGILPLDGTGVLAIRKGLQHTQIVFQVKPEEYLVTWGYHEGDSNAITYKVAQPYRIIIGDIVDGNLLGARHFYSPVAVQTGDQMMYHVNLPNLNCKGYKGTGVGWMCLYHTSNWSADSFDTKVRKLVERASGAEAYNDANMSSTDGPRFYKEHHANSTAKSFLWDPHAWQDKTKAEGYEWTLDSSLWIPVKVESIDSQAKHDPNGVPLTLEMAMLGKYNAYYTDPHQPKPVNSWARTDLASPEGEKIFAFLGKAFVTSTKKLPPAPVVPGVQVKTLLTPENAPAPTQPAQQYTYTAPPPDPNPVVGTCWHCGIVLKQGLNPYTLQQGNKVCDSCLDANYALCAGCHKQTNYGYLQVWNNNGNNEDTFYCHDCHEVVTCPNCGMTYLDDWAALIELTHCLDCSEYEFCSDCNNKFTPDNIHKLEAKVPNVDTGQLEEKEINLCHECMSHSVTCGCGLIKHEDETGLLGTGTYACGGCIGYTENGYPMFEPQSVFINSIS